MLVARSDQAVPVAPVAVREMLPSGSGAIAPGGKPGALEGGGVLADKKGYGFDGCSPKILLARAEVRDGLIAFPGGSSYRLLVLPQVETMTPGLLAKIRDLVKAGATMVGAPNTCLSGFSSTAPTTTAGMVATTTCQKIRRSDSALGPRLTSTASAKFHQSRQK